VAARFVVCQAFWGRPVGLEDVLKKKKPVHKEPAFGCIFERGSC